MFKLIKQEQNANIQIVNLDVIPFLDKEFLDFITKPIHKTGIKRNNYYILNLNSIHRITPTNEKGFYFVKMLQRSLALNHSHLMITYEYFT